MAFRSSASFPAAIGSGTTAQYPETDLNFVSRIAEHEGIYRFFEHAAGKHTLVLADGIASHAALPGRSTVNYIGLDAATVADEEHFYAWRPREELDSGEYLTTDYDFKRPKADLSTRQAPGWPHV